MGAAPQAHWPRHRPPVDDADGFALSTAAPRREREGPSSAMCCHTKDLMYMRSDIVPGAIFPNYELSDHTAKHRKLSELQGQDPMVLVLSRGGYCPNDRRQAQRLLELHRQPEAGYCPPLTTTTHPPFETSGYRSSSRSQSPLLSHPAPLSQP